MTLPENSAGNFVTKIIALIITKDEKALEVFAETELPFLGFPVVKQVFEYFVEKYLGELSIDFQDGAIKIVLNVQVAAELSSLLEALKNLNDANKSGEADEIKKAMDAWQKIGRFDGIISHY